MNNNFNKDERKLITWLSLTISLRMLGGSLIIPFLSIYAVSIQGSTGTLAGIAFAIFSIMQTLFQIPMGRLSDKWGRKKTTVLGLFVYFLGSMLSGLSMNIYHLIFSRMIAGAGAIRGVILTWLTEEIDVGRRNHALSFVGIGIGASMILGFSISSFIAGKLGIRFLFFFCAFLLLGSMIFIIFKMKDTGSKMESLRIEKDSFGSILKCNDLIRLNLLGLLVNLSFVSIFFTLPLLINKIMIIENMWKIFVPMAVIGTGLMYIFSKKADLKGTVPISIIAICFIIAGLIIPVINSSLYSFIASFILFYSGYCIMSPILPAAVSRHPNTTLKGTAMGLLNSAQFIGSSIGGFLSGIMKDYDHRYLFTILLVLTIAGLITILGFKDFEKEKGQLL